MANALLGAASSAGPRRPALSIPVLLIGDFPARKPGEPSVTKVTRTIEFHLLCPWQLT
jgi:hypothetical protein